MGAVATPVLYSLFVWWFATGLVFLAVLRTRKAVFWSLLGAAFLFPVSLVVIAKSSADPSVWGAYVAFTAVIVLWGTQEVAFLTGFLTGPRPLPCPPDVFGWRRAAYAIGAILYHELALVGSGLAIVAVSYGEINQVGTATFAVLWAMRLSAKLNLFLGVPVLNDEMMPDHLTYLRSYFRRGPVNGLFPVAMILAILVTERLFESAFAVEVNPAAQAGGLLLGALMGLAILEHGFMLVRLPIDALWRWSTRGRVQSETAAGSALADIHRREQPRELGDIKSALPTGP